MHDGMQYDPIQCQGQGHEPLFYFIVINITGDMYIKTLAAQQGCKTLTVACLKHKTVY